MPAYLAKVQGENFHFYFDDDHQIMSFTRTVYVEGADETKAEMNALEAIQHQLRSSALWNEEGEQLVMVNELEPYNEACTLSIDHDFFWYFAE